MIVKAGSTDVTTYVVLRKAADGTELTAATITNIDLVYTRSGADHVAKVDATALAAVDSAHGDNKAIEVDATSAPGLYRVDWPDAAFAVAVREVILTVIYATALTVHLRVELSPQVDTVAISGDTVAADNCESDYDGTGYVGGTIKKESDMVAIHGTALTETATQLAAAFKKFFDVATPVLTCESVNQAGDAHVHADAIDTLTKAVGNGDLAAMKACTDLVTAARMGALTDLIDGGRLDLLVDAIKACTDLVTAARMGALTDLIDGGRLDLLIDAIKACTDLVTAARMGALTDLIDGGRLDLILDAILTDTGTTLQGELDAIEAAVITNAAGADIAADIIALKAVVDAVLADTGTDGVVVAAASKTGYALSATGADLVGCDVATVGAAPVTLINKVQAIWNRLFTNKTVIAALETSKEKDNATTMETWNLADDDTTASRAV